MKTRYYRVVEKLNMHALHALCETRASAKRWVATNAVEYCRKGYFADKTLTPGDFVILAPDVKGEADES